jgi:cohesin loading factor subunit SCC2
MFHVSHLIALSTDPTAVIRDSAQQQLTDMYGQYHDFVSQKAVAGALMAYQFRQALADAGSATATSKPTSAAAVRGVDIRSDGTEPSAALAHLYVLLRAKKAVRRQFLTGVVAKFIGANCEINTLLYLADNLAHFPYVTNAEPLFLIHEIASLAAVRGTAISGQFQTLLRYNDAVGDEEDEDDAVAVLARLGDREEGTLVELRKAVLASQAFVVILSVKQYLQRTFGFTESRCEAFDPAVPNKANETKVRHTLGPFEHPMLEQLDTAEQLAAAYLSFRDAMASGEYLFEGDEDEADEAGGPAADHEIGEELHAEEDVMEEPEAVEVAVPAKSSGSRKKGFAKAVADKRMASAKKNRVTKAAANKETGRKKSKSKKKSKKRKKYTDESDDSGEDSDYDGGI